MVASKSRMVTKGVAGARGGGHQALSAAKQGRRAGGLDPRNLYSYILILSARHRIPRLPSIAQVA